MNKLFKWLLAAAGIFVVLFIVVALVLPLVIDPNNYKENFRTAVNAQTGRDLTIGGEIKWTVFPWIGLELNDISLNNRTGFGEQPMLSIGTVAISVKLIPLFHRQLELGKLILNDVSVNLRRDADGSNNWEDLGNTQSGATANASQGGGDIQAFTIAQIQINNTNISWDNAGQITELMDFHLTASHIELGQPFKLQGGFSVNLAQLDLSGEVRFGGLIQSGADGARYRIQGLELSFEGQQGSADAPVALNLAVNANVDVDLDSDQATLSDFALRFHDFALGGQLNVASLTGEPRVAGDLKIAEFSPRALLTAMGVKAPQTADADALTSLQAEMSFSGSSSSAEMRNLHIEFDQSSYEGKFRIENFDHPKIAFDFQIDKLNLDNYMTVTTGETDTSDLPVEVFRGFSGRGELKVGQLIVAGLNATDISLTVSSDGRGVRLFPVDAKFYGGQHRGDFKIDANGDTPILIAHQELSGVQAASLLQDLTGSARLEGTGNLNLDIRTDISNDLTTRQALAGKVKLDFQDGAIVGINIAESIRRAKAALNRETDSTKQTERNPKTDFSELSMSGIIKQGIMRSDDLMLRSPLLRVTGKGQIDLVRETIDYRVKPVVVGSLEGQGGTGLDELNGVPIPVKLSGNLYEPDIAIDIVAAITGVQKAKLNAKKNALKNKVLGKLLGGDDKPEAAGADQTTGGKPDDSGDNAAMAKDLLKGLFGSKRSKDKEKSDDGGDGSP